MAKYTWFKKDVPENLCVKQVYGIVFDDAGRVLLRIEDNHYKLTGGRPEKIDANLEETLKREYFEELHVLLEEIIYLGYLLVEEKNSQYAQVRMIAKIKSIFPFRPDLDNGKLYKRFLTNQNSVKKYLNYKDEAGNKMLDEAFFLANKSYHFSFIEEEIFV